MAKLKKSRFNPPYITKGKTTYKDIQGKSGVYLVKNKAGTIVYVGMSQSQLYKTMYRHFQSWSTSKQIRVTYPKFGYTVRVVLCTPKQAFDLEKALILKYKPKDNPNKLQQYELSVTEENIQEVYDEAEAMRNEEFLPW